MWHKSRLLWHSGRLLCHKSRLLADSCARGGGAGGGCGPFFSQNPFRVWVLVSLYLDSGSHLDCRSLAVVWPRVGLRWASGWPPVRMSGRMPAGCRPDASQMPAGCRPDAGRMPARCRPDGGWMPAGCRPDASQMPAGYVDIHFAPGV